MEISVTAIRIRPNSGWPASHRILACCLISAALALMIPGSRAVAEPPAGVGGGKYPGKAHVTSYPVSGPRKITPFTGKAPANTRRNARAHIANIKWTPRRF